MSRTIGYTESIKGTSYRSFKIRTDGPTIYTESDLSGEIVKDGDLWIRNDSISQYVGGAWLSVATNDDIVSDPTYVYVSSNVSGFTPDGSMFKPFASIQAAHDYAVSNLTSFQHVVINVYPGIYSGFTLTRPRTTVKGAAHGISEATQITTGITVSPSSIISGSLFNSPITLENMKIGTTNTTPLLITGAIDSNIYVRNVKLFTANTGVVGLIANSSANTRLEVIDSYISNINSSTVAANLSNMYPGSNLSRTTIYAGAGPCLRLNSGQLNADDIYVGSNNYANSIEVVGGVLQIGYSTIFNETANSDGLSLKSGSTTVMVDCAINIPTGSGFVANGQAGAVLMHGGNTFVNNRKFSATMGAGIIPLANSPTIV